MVRGHNVRRAKKCGKYTPNHDDVVRMEVEGEFLYYRVTSRLTLQSSECAGDALFNGALRPENPLLIDPDETVWSIMRWLNE